MRRKNLFISVLMVTGLVFLTGCGNDSAENSFVENQAEDVAVSDTEETKNEFFALEGENPDQEEEGSEINDSMPKEVPQLPETGAKLADFVPEGWELLDSVELDFNEDGMTDYVGILREADIDPVDYIWETENFPRILFALAGDGMAGYRMDFQDSELLSGEICYDGTLSAEGVAFTTHTGFGSGLHRWKRSGSSSTYLDHTYTYREGSWWHTLSQEICRYGDYIVYYEKNDWENGVKIRKRASTDWADIEERWDFIENGERSPEEYDLEYELPLDEPPMSLEQIRAHEELSPYGVTDWEVKDIIFAEGAELLENMVKTPDEKSPGVSCEWGENDVFYVFSVDSGKDREFDCLAIYDRQNKALSVLAKEETEIDDICRHKGKIYYSVKIMEEEEAVGVRLNRMELDGSGKETIFEYRYQGTEQEIQEDGMPSLGLYFEIGGDEIVAQVYIGNGNLDPFYRMKTDGSGREKIGQMPQLYQ